MYKYATDMKMNILWCKGTLRESSLNYWGTKKQEIDYINTEMTGLPDENLSELGNTNYAPGLHLAVFLFFQILDENFPS